MTVDETPDLPAVNWKKHPIDPAVAKAIRLVGLDIDGTLTDGGVYLGAATDGDRIFPVELKRFDIQDGMGISLLRQAGIKVVIITGRVSEAVRMRAEELRVDALVQDSSAFKLQAWRELCLRMGIEDSESAFVGDDLPDLPVLRVVRLPVATCNASEDVKRAAIWNLSKNGGHGAIREFAEGLLHARGEWHDQVEHYVKSRSGAI